MIKDGCYGGAMVMWPVWSNGNIEGTTCRIGDDKSGYFAFYCGRNFNIGCNANTTITNYFCLPPLYRKLCDQNAKQTVFCSEVYVVFCLLFWHSVQLPNFKKCRLCLLRDVGAETKIGQLPTKVFLLPGSLFVDTSGFSENLHVSYCFQGYRYM